MGVRAGEPDHTTISAYCHAHNLIARTLMEWNVDVLVIRRKKCTFYEGL